MESSLWVSIFVVAVYAILRSHAAQTETFDVRTSITARFAETAITSIVRNERSSNQEIGFQVLLPKEAFISGFSMVIGGKSYDAVVEEKERARKAFEAAKQLNKTAGLVETREESTKTFRTSVTIEAGETVQFRLVYHQLLRRIRGKYKHQIILLGSQLTDILTIEVDICETEEIRSIAVPPVLDSEGNNVTVQTVIDQERYSAHVEYLQGKNDDVINALASSGGSFTVEYELETIPEGGKVVLNNGYFAYFYAPVVEIEPRRVVFTLDVSGSMIGQKISQLKEAMINIIDKLTVEDRFTIVTFENVVKTWRDYLVTATRENIEAAKEFIKGMRASGGTNINNALTTSITLLNSDIGDATADSKSNYIVFLTDGRPTAGVSHVPVILDNVDAMNAKNLAVHAVGFGQGVDANFLKSLAARNQGSWTQILVDINAALQIQNYLDELGTPQLDDLVIDYPENIVDEFIVHNSSFLAGGELISMGRLKENIDPRNRGPHTIEITGRSGGGVVIKAQFYLDDEIQSCKAVKGNVVRDFGMKAFALTDILETLRLYNAETDGVLKDQLREAAVNKSISAGLVTPVTSLLVIKPEDKAAIEEKLEEEQTTTPATTTTRAPVIRTILPTTVPLWQFMNDPHFMVRLTNSISTCFNWPGQNGEIYNLLNDPRNGIVVNGLVNGPVEGNGSSHVVFITKLVVILKKEHLVIIVDSKNAIVRDTTNKKNRRRDLKLPLVEVAEHEVAYGPVTFRIRDANRAHTILNITVANTINFVVNLHHPPSHATEKSVDHLDLMISGTEKLSPDVSGVFGRFPRKIGDKDEESASIEKAGAKSYLWYGDRVAPATKTSMMVPYLKKKVDCWFVTKPSILLGATLDSFQVQSLFQIPKKITHM